MLQKTNSPWLLELVSIYIKLSPIGGNEVAPLSPVGEFVFVERIKVCILPELFLSLQKIRQLGSKYPPWLGYFIIVVSVICILSYLVKL